MDNKFRERKFFEGKNFEGKISETFMDHNSREKF